MHIRLLSHFGFKDVRNLQLFKWSKGKREKHVYSSFEITYAATDLRKIGCNIFGRSFAICQKVEKLPATNVYVKIPWRHYDEFIQCLHTNAYLIVGSIQKEKWSKKKFNTNIDNFSSAKAVTSSNSTFLYVEIGSTHLSRIFYWRVMLAQIKAENAIYLMCKSALVHPHNELWKNSYSANWARFETLPSVPLMSYLWMRRWAFCMFIRVHIKFKLLKEAFESTYL